MHINTHASNFSTRFPWKLNYVWENFVSRLSFLVKKKVNKLSKKKILTKKKRRIKKRYKIQGYSILVEITQNLSSMVIRENGLHKKLELTNNAAKRYNLDCVHRKKNRQSDTVTLTLTFTIDSPISFLSLFFHIASFCECNSLGIGK